MAAAAEHEKSEKIRLEALRQKSCHNQSAVASPEVKRHLQEFVLQKKRKEAAASMNNLKMVPAMSTSGSQVNGTAPGPHGHPSSSTSPLGAILRKTASESNLLKMKMKPKRVGGDSGMRAGPYQRGSGNPSLHMAGREPSIPETQAISIVGNQNSSDSLQGSPCSNHSSSSFGSAAGVGGGGSTTRPQLVRDLSLTNPGITTNSTPTSPKQLHIPTGKSTKNHNHPYENDPLRATRRPSPASIAAANINSKSLPNIPSAIGRFTGKDNYKMGRRSPPSTSNARPTPHHSAMLVRRSKSSAILPLRKHLIEKTLMDKALDDERLYYEQQKEMTDRLSSSIRPIEEVMEEDGKRVVDSSIRMEVDGESSSHQRTLFARLGHAGLSPLVLGEVANPTQDYISSLLPIYQQQLMQAAAVSCNASSFEPNTGIGFDPLMLKHQCECESTENHPENPLRVGLIWEHLVNTKLADQCVRVARECTLEEIQSVHSTSHAMFYSSELISSRQPNSGGTSATGSSRTARGKLSLLKCGGVGVDSDTYWNEMHTATSARYAVGTVTELSTKVRVCPVHH